MYYYGNPIPKKLNFSNFSAAFVEKTAVFYFYLFATAGESCHNYCVQVHPRQNVGFHARILVYQRVQQERSGLLVLIPAEPFVEALEVELEAFRLFHLADVRKFEYHFPQMLIGIGNMNFGGQEG